VEHDAAGRTEELGRVRRCRRQIRRDRREKVGTRKSADGIDDQASDMREIVGVRNFQEINFK
jgi:hypothetical protein